MVGLALLLLLALYAVRLVDAGQVEQTSPEFAIAGQLIDSQNQPVADARVSAKVAGQEEPLDEVDSQEDGTFVLELDTQLMGAAAVWL